MSHRYAPYILATLGTLLSVLGYYLDAIYQVKCEGILWTGVFFILSVGGFIIGKLIQKLTVSSYTDFLTNLFNRRYFYLRLNEEEAKASRKRTQLCIAMIDADNFKAINDTYGHAVGDVLLADLSAILTINTRVTDIVTRWGGDEFAIIFPDTSPENSLEIVERIRTKVEKKFSSYHLTISVGIIELRPDQDLKSLLNKADQALYQAKKQKNAVITIRDDD